MTKEELIDLFFSEYCDGICFDDLQAFAKLVAEAEREACAKIVEESSLPDTYSEPCLLDIANEIRERGDEV